MSTFFVKEISKVVEGLGIRINPLMKWMLSFHLPSSVFCDLYITKIAFYVDAQQLKKGN